MQRLRPEGAQPTGEIGVGDGFVPGDGGEGTSMSGVCVGMPGGGSVGWPGFDGSGMGGDGFVGGSLGSGCCIKGSNAPENSRLPPLRLAPRATPVIGRATYGVRARGGIGRRGRFRSCCRKMWGFESLRAHHRHAQAIRGIAEHDDRAQRCGRFSARIQELDQ
jgi:hypothetical protein